MCGEKMAQPSPAAGGVDFGLHQDLMLCAHHGDQFVWLICLCMLPAAAVGHQRAQVIRRKSKE